MAGRLDGKVAIVTGAGSGIGEAIAHRFAEENAAVVIAEWNHDAGARSEADIRARGGRGLFIPTDVSRAADVEAMVRRTVSEFGRLDILVNNAAIQILGRLADTSEEDWDRIQSVNLKGVFLCSKYAITEMLRSGAARSSTSPRSSAWWATRTWPPTAPPKGACSP